MQLLASNTKEDDQDKAECEIKLEAQIPPTIPYLVCKGNYIEVHRSSFSSKYTRNGFLRLQLQDFGLCYFTASFIQRLAFHSHAIFGSS